MQQLLNASKWICTAFALPALICCNISPQIPSKEAISQVNLKRGAVISCGAADKQFGSVNFDITGSEQTKTDFNLAIALLHSFEYDEAEKVFAKIIDAAPGCAMAYWGVAMCNFHALWTPPSAAELVKGSKAIAIAQGIAGKPERETAYINAMAAFYAGWDKTDHPARCIRYEKAMEKIHAAYPADKEAAIFYALALDAAADPSDKTFAKQKKAGALLNALYPSEPNHPGIIHYIIHTYDYPGLADSALEAARRYAKVAPSSAHALHMPSHIFTRLGLWDECIQSNEVSVAAAKCYAEQAGIKGHWDEELHGMDYLVYAWLQKGDTKKALEQLVYLQSVTNVQPANFKVAYAFAAIPARIYLENKNWKAAANTQLSPADFPWSKFPWQSAITHFTRLMGAAHLGNKDLAAAELNTLKQLHDTLAQQKDTYKANQLAIQIKTAGAWIQYFSGQKPAAINNMTIAANMEDATEKHPVTPGEVLPARELLADMLFEMGQYQNALTAYEAVLQKSPRRFNAVYGAGSAADKLHNRQKAALYYRQLLSVAGTANAGRPEIASARQFLSLP